MDDDTAEEALVGSAAWRRQARQAALEAGTTVLPDGLSTWIDRYRQIGARERYLWHWVVRGLRLTMLSSVPPAAHEEVITTKVLSVTLVVLLDDIADEQQDAARLDEVLLVLLNGSPASADPLLVLVSDLWQEVHRRLRRLERHVEFADLLAFDYAQLFNAMRYSLLVNRKPSLLNLTENELYLSHNMHMMINFTVDLMASPGLDTNELHLLREVFWHAQRMGRIGNHISTWERELADGDYTSCVFSYGLRHGLFGPADLAHPTLLKTALDGSGVEDHFLTEWQQHHDAIRQCASRLRTVDCDRLLRGLEQFIQLHMGSVGLK